MAKRFHSESIYTYNDANLYVIELHDSSFSGSSTEFKVTPEGFTLRPDRSGNDRHEPVTVTLLSFNMFIQNITHRALITDLTTSQEGRFKAKVTKNGNLHWVGNVIIDLGKTEDRNYPYTFEVKATDLGTLANIDHKDTSTAYDGWETTIAHVIRCLDKTGLPEFAWSGSDIMLSTVDNWYEDSMPTGNDKDPQALTRNHHRAFYEVDEQGKFNYMNTLEVLRQLMRIKGCNLRQSAGRFRIFQITAFNEATPRQRHYDKDGTYLSNSADAYTKTIDQTVAGGSKLAGVEFTWLPPLKEVKLIYRHRNWTNIMSGATLGDGVPFTGPDLVASANPFNLVASLKVQRTLINGGTPSGTAYFEKYKFQFKVGSYYLKRNLIQITNGSAQYEQPTWSTTASYYHFSFLNTGFFPQPSGSGSLIDTFEFTIPPFPADGASTFDASQDGFTLATGGGSPSITFGSVIVITGYVSMNFGDKPTDMEYKVPNPDTTANSVDYSITTNIAAGSTENTVGRLQVQSSGGTWSDANATDGWTIGGTGTERLLQTLLIEEIMAGQRTPVKKMVGTIGYMPDYEAHMRLSDGTNVWAFMGGTYSARMDDWTGEWYFIQREPTDIVADTPISIPGGIGIPPHAPPGGPIRLPGQHTSAPVPFPDVPTIPSFPQIPNSNGTGFLLGNMSGVSTSSSIPQGAVTSIALNQSTVAGGYQAGQLITVLDAVNNVSQSFTVAVTSAAGDTSIAVSGYAPTDIAPGAFVITPQSFGVVEGQSSEGTGVTFNSMPWPLIAQRWTRDDANDPEWPIEAYNIGIETDENAGDGATAGLRIDGDGISSYTASSPTAGVQITTSGKLKLSGLATGTATDVLIVESGEVKKKTITPGVTDHGALSGLGDDDHSQYHNDARGDARYYTQAQLNSGQLDSRYYTETELDAGQLDNRYFRENEHLNTSAGIADAGKPIKLDSSGHVDASMINDGDITHANLSGLTADDHPQYGKLAGRSGGQTLNGGTGNNEDLTLNPTIATGGFVVVGGQMKINTVNDDTADSSLTALTRDSTTIKKIAFKNSTAGLADAYKPVQLDAIGMLSDSMVNFKHTIPLLPVGYLTTVTQTINTPFYDSIWLVPAELHDYYIYRVDYALLNSTATSGTLKVGLRIYDSTNASVATNQAQVTFTGSQVRATATPNIQLDSGYWMHVHTDTASGGTLNNTVAGLAVTIYITKI